MITIRFTAEFASYQRATRVIESILTAVQELLATLPSDGVRPGDWVELHRQMRAAPWLPPAP